MHDHPPRPPRVLPSVSSSGALPGVGADPTPTDRGTFLRTAGSVALFAALGISLQGCRGSDPVGPGSSTPPVNPPTDPGGGTPGLTLSGSILGIDLANPGFSGLKVAGGWLALVRAVSGRQLNVLAVNVDGTTIRAFSSVCPHQGCNNNWQYANQRFRCTCHDSVFENTGKRVSGPAPRDLTEYPVSRNGDTLAVTVGT